MTSIHSAWRLIFPLSIQVGCLNETSTQVAFDNQSCGLVEGAPGSINDPTSERQVLHHPANQLPISSFGAQQRYSSSDAYNVSGMGVLHMAYQGLRAASMLDKVQDVALAAQQQQEKQVLQDLMDLRSLIAASALPGTAVQQQTDTSLQLATKASDGLGQPRVNAAEGKLHRLRSVSTPSSHTAGADRPTSLPPHLVPVRPVGFHNMEKQASLRVAEDEVDDYSEDAFEEALVSPYHSTGSDDISEEIYVAEEEDSRLSLSTPVCCVLQCKCNMLVP